MSYDLRMKKFSTWLLILLLAREVQAQLQVVPDCRPQAVFGGMNQNITVQFRNGGGQSLESDLRIVLLQTSTATAVRISEGSWKKLLVLPGQTVLEKATVPFPAVRGETRFLLQWLGSDSNVIGQTEVSVSPTNLLAHLKTLAGGEPLGVFDPADALKPLLRMQAMEFQDLLEDGTKKFRGKLAVFGPFETQAQMRASLREDIRALAKRGGAVVWLLPPPEKRAPLKPSFYALREGKGAVVVAHHDLVAQLAECPEAQLNLVRLAEEALQPTSLELPETETSN
jgi:hypothetical protein